MIPWWGWLLISLSAAYVLYIIIAFVVVGIIFRKIKKNL